MRRPDAPSAGSANRKPSTSWGFTFVCGKSRRGRFLVERKSRRDRMRAKLREIKEEITSEIEIYAQAYDLDLVLEKTVNAEGDPRGGVSFQWPIVHYAKPEIDITSQIVKRLNERYQKVR